MVELDDIDRAILALLQTDASKSVQDVADAVGLSQNPCWRRIKRLEHDGIIERRVALVDPIAVGLGVTVFVSLKTSQHNAKWLSRFADGVEKIPEITEVYRMSGDIDYLLKVLVASIDDYDRVYQKLIEVAELADVSSSFAMERMKFSTAVAIPEPKS